MQEGVDRGADALLIPEFCTGAAAVWNTSPPGKALSWFMEFAKEHEVYVAPASYIRDQRGDKYNAVVLIDPAGHIMGFSGKKHLYYTDCNLGNAKRHMEFPVFDTRCGRLAFGVCEDMDNFETGLISRLHGAEILAIPSRQPAPTYLANYVTLAQAMASQNALFVCAIGEGYAPFSTTSFCGPRLDWDPRSAKDVHDVEDVLRSFLDGQNFSREAVEKLGRELSGRHEVLVTPEDTHIYTIGRELQAIIADRTSAMVLLAKVELNWYRQAINIEPPLSAICTPADVDRHAAQTIIHDFVYSRYEMPFADYIRFMAPYSAEKRVRRLLHDIVRGASERPELEDIEKLIATLERVEKALSEAHINPDLESELSLGSLPVVLADLAALKQIRNALRLTGP